MGTKVCFIWSNRSYPLSHLPLMKQFIPVAIISLTACASHWPAVAGEIAPRVLISQSSYGRERDLLAAGLTKYQKGDYQGAISDYSKAIDLNRNYAEAYNNRGNARAAINQRSAAINDFTQAVRINSNDEYAYSNRGTVYLEDGKKEQALTDFNKAIKINPSYAKAYYHRGLANSDLGNWREAVSDFTNAISRSSQYAKAYYQRADVKERDGDRSGARTDFQKAADLYKQQGKISSYQESLERSRRL